tara:strand:- start:176 stop:454 length:279 start_codon:yes stop_codon:yes gene_type:complete
MFLIVHPPPMELTKNSLDFISNHFGYTPERMTMNNPDGSQSTAYLIPSKNGLEPWPVKRIEAYVAWMTSTMDEKVAILQQVESLDPSKVEVV